MVLRATAAPPRRMSSRELIGRSSAQHASSCGRWQQLETDAELASGASAKVNRRPPVQWVGKGKMGQNWQVGKRERLEGGKIWTKYVLVRFQTNLLPTTDSSAVQGVRQVVNLLLSR